MKEQSKPILWAGYLLFFLAIFFFHHYSLMSFPSPFLDESVTLRGAYQYLGLVEGSFFQPVFVLLEGTGLTTYAFHPVYAFFTKVFSEDHYFAIRFATLCFGMFILFSCFLSAKKLGGVWAGVFTSLFLSFSYPFLVSAHLARHDVIGLAFGYAAFAYSLHSPKRVLAGALCALLIVCGFCFHPRTAIPGAVIFLFQLLDATKNKSQRNWLLGYSMSGAVGLILYFLAQKFSASSTAPIIEALYEWRKPSIFSADVFEMFNSIIESARIALIVTGVSSILIVVLLLLFFERNNRVARQCLVLLVSSIVVGGLLIVSKSTFKIVSFTPFLAIVQGVVLSRLIGPKFDWIPERFEFVWKSLVIVMFILSVFQIGREGMFVLRNEYNCNLELTELGKVLNKSISPEETILGEELYWLKLPRENYISNRSIVLYKKVRPDATLDEIMNVIKPNVLVLDHISEYFFSEIPKSNKFDEGLRFSSTELETYITKAKIDEERHVTKCFGTVRVVRFSPR